MENPLRLSNIVIENLEISCVNNCKKNLYFIIVMWMTLFSIYMKKNITNTLYIFNLYDKNDLQFTVEHSENNSISFLNLIIINNDHRNIIANWYWKSTFSGRYRNFNSHHPINNKIAIIYCLVDRAIKSSQNSSYKKNIDFTKQVLQNNDYPHNLVDFQIRKCLEKKCLEKKCLEKLQ